MGVPTSRSCGRTANVSSAEAPATAIAPPCWPLLLVKVAPLCDHLSDHRVVVFGEAFLQLDHEGTSGVAVVTVRVTVRDEPLADSASVTTAMAVNPGRCVIMRAA